MEKIILTNEQIDQLVDELLGTWRNGLQVLSEIIGQEVDSWDNVDDDSYDAIFNEVEKCDGCDFWCLTGGGEFIKDKFYCSTCSVEDPTLYDEEPEELYYEALICNLADHVGHKVEIIEGSDGCVSLICHECGDVITDTDILEEEIGCR